MPFPDAVSLAGVLLIAIGMVVVPSAAALVVASARVAKGAVQVRGRQATPDAILTWEGEPIAQANGQGRFRFADREDQ